GEPALLTRAVSMGGKSSRSGGGGRSAGPDRKKGKRSGRDSRGAEEEQEDWETLRAEYHAALLLLVHSAKDLPLLATKMGTTHLAGAVSALLRQEGGLRAVSALLAALPPLAAARFLYDHSDPSPCLLPPEVRRQLLAAMPPERVKSLEAVARGASEAATQRARRVRTTLNVWCAARYVSSPQVAAVLGALRTEGDRVMAMVVLWPRVVDGGWKSTYLRLTPGEQRQVMTRLGYWHVYACLADPHGIAFSLDLGEPEQRDIARELVRMAVKETQRARQEAKARGAGAANIQTLLNLHGNGNPVSVPEDEKLWGMADSNFRSMEFLYSPTLEQSLDKILASAVCIQRFWVGVQASRAARRALVAQLNGRLPAPERHAPKPPQPAAPAAAEAESGAAAAGAAAAPGGAAPSASQQRISASQQVA
ncbi:hypothetical protein Agub_g3269, partial [Astrephomene gubernaculifera]